ncbi:hypothetical protein ACQRBF_05685 [Peptoniphilaceae bacterium SGI.131]
MKKLLGKILGVLFAVILSFQPFINNIYAEESEILNASDNTEQAENLNSSENNDGKKVDENSKEKLDLEESNLDKEDDENKEELPVEPEVKQEPVDNGELFPSEEVNSDEDSKVKETDIKVDTKELEEVNEENSKAQSLGQERAAATSDQSNVGNYYYEVKPVLGQFNNFLYVKTNNPDPYSFELVDEDSIYKGEDGYRNSYSISQKIYLDVNYEDKATFRVKNGYIFEHGWFGASDGGRLYIYENSSGGFVKTSKSVILPRLYNPEDYLIDKYTSKNLSLFENLSKVQKFLDEMAVYPLFLKNPDKMLLKYPYLEVGRHKDQSFKFSPYLYENLGSANLLLEGSYPFVLDSLGFPKMMSSVAKKLDPTAKIVHGTMGHACISVEKNGEINYYGGKGKKPTYNSVKGIRTLYYFDASSNDLYSQNSIEKDFEELMYIKENSPLPNLSHDEWNFERLKNFIGSGKWLRASYGVGDIITYFTSGTRENEYVQIPNETWVDGRYIDEYKNWIKGAKFADYPNADFILKDYSYIDYAGNTIKGDILFKYDGVTDTWSIPKYIYYNYTDMPDDGQKVPKEYVFNRSQVKALNLDSNTDIYPVEEYVFNGKVPAGTPVVTRYIKENTEYFNLYRLYNTDNSDYTISKSVEGLKYKGQEVVGFYEGDYFRLINRDGNYYISASKVQENPILTGIWKEEKNGWTYIRENGIKANSEWLWLQVGVNEFAYKYFDKNGISIDQFYKEIKNGETKFYLSLAGPGKGYSKGWWTDPSNGLKYYFRTSTGSRVEGRQYIDEGWKFFRIGSGSQAFGWQYIDGNWQYYNKETGNQVFGRAQIDGKYYYLNSSNGAREYGWKNIGYNWFYFDKSTGVGAVSKWLWLELEGQKGKFSWKFFDKYGISIDQFRKESSGIWLSQAGPSKDYYKGWWIDPSNGQKYYFRTTSGSRVEGRQHIGRYWYFFRIGSGTQAFGRQYVDGVWRYYHEYFGIELN